LFQMTPQDRALKDSIATGCSGDRFAENNTDHLLGLRDMVYSDGSTSAVPAALKPTTSDTTTPLFTLKLSDLFPALRNRQLPLAYLPQAYLRLEWNQQPNTTTALGTICCGVDGTTKGAVDISTVNISFQSDILFYSSKVMAEVARQVASENGLQSVIEDEILTLCAVPAVADPTAGTHAPNPITKDLALSGRTVRSIVVCDNQSSHPLLGPYSSQANRVGETLNIVVNDSHLYSKPLDSPSKIAREAGFAMGHPPQMPNALYSMDTASPKSGAAIVSNFSAATVEGLATALDGQQHIAGFDLTKDPVNHMYAGTTFGSKPARFEKTYNVSNGEHLARTCRVYANVERLFTIKGGVVEMSQ